MSELYDKLNTLDDVEAFVQQGIRETEVLEYKQASAQWTDGDKKEVSKDVSAMANALGGTIIYGVMKHKTDKELPGAIDSAEIHPSNIAAFDQILGSSVRPALKGIRKKLIPNTKPRVMMVDIPESEDRPHQDLKSHRYYRRSGAHSLPMDHDLVASQFGRQTGPIVDLVPVLPSAVVPHSGDQKYAADVPLRLEFRNSAKRVAREVVALIMFPPREQVEVSIGSGSVTNIDRLYPGRQAIQVSHGGVIHPRLSISAAEVTLRLTLDFVQNHVEKELVSWTVYADEMIERSGSRTLGELGVAVVTTPKPKSC